MITKNANLARKLLASSLKKLQSKIKNMETQQNQEVIADKENSQTDLFGKQG